MSSYPGAGFIFSPTMGNAYGGMNAITYDTIDPKTNGPVKAKDPVHRPYMSGAAGQWPGYGIGPGGLNLYWAYLLRKYPICKVIHKKLAAPIMAGTRSIEITDDGGNADLAKEIQKTATAVLIPLLEKAIPGALESPFYGNWLQEIIYQKVDGRIDPVDVRPIQPYERTIHVDEFRQYSGYVVQGEYRDRRYGFLYVHNEHIDPVLGWSENEAAVADYFRATKSAENADRIERKASGIQILMYVMEGVEFVDDAGSIVDNQNIIDRVLQAAVEGKSAKLPLMSFSKRAIEANPALAGVELIKTDRFDWGNLGPMIEAHTGRERNLDVHICWAWGVSERSIMEADKGGIGTSDAGDHAESNILTSEQWNASICRQWNKQVTDLWLETNYPDSGVKLGAKPSPLADPQQKFLQALTTAMFTNPTTAVKCAARTDLPKLLERVEIPMLDEKQAEANEAEFQAEQDKQNEAKIKQLQSGQTGKPGAVPEETPENKNGQDGK